MHCLVRLNDLQARIDKAIQCANDNQTPWFAAECLFEDETIKNDLTGMAECQAEDAKYAEANEYVIDGII